MANKESVGKPAQKQAADCPKCGATLEWVGMERRLITRGKNKGQSVVRQFYACSANCDGN